MASLLQNIIGARANRANKHVMFLEEVFELITEKIKFSLLAWFLAIASLFASISVVAAVSDGDSAKQRLIVYTPPNSPPKSYFKNDKLTGAVVELTVEALRRAGYVADMQAPPWVRSVKGAEDGEGLITNFSHSPERDKLFYFSKEPIFHDTVVLVTRWNADFKFKSLKDLSGRTIGMMRGASFGPAFEAALPMFTDDRDQGADQRFKKLMMGRIDGAIVSSGRAGVRYHLQAAGIDPRDVIVHDPPIVVDPNYIAISRSYPNGQEILNRISKAIVSMRNDGTMAKILAEYE